MMYIYDRKAFTLVELLVVMAIIAILAGLLIPTIQEALVRGRIASNTNQMHQIGLGLAMYSSPDAYNMMPRWKADGVADGDGDPGDDTEQELVTALGRLYAGGSGIVGDWRVFSCPGNPSKAPNTHGPQINGKDDINHDDETSYSFTRGAGIGDPQNKIVLADEGDGAGKGFHNWADRGQSVLFLDTHADFIRTDNPDTDSDDGSIYVEDAGDRKDTILY